MNLDQNTTYIIIALIIGIVVIIALIKTNILRIKVSDTAVSLESEKKKPETNGQGNMIIKDVKNKAKITANLKDKENIVIEKIDDSEVNANSKE